MIGDTLWGAYAEYVVVTADQLISLPEEVSFDDAACLPVAYGTAHRMMLTRGGVTADDSVLILGASGGVGTSALLLAKCRVLQLSLLLGPMKNVSSYELWALMKLSTTPLLIL